MCRCELHNVTRVTSGAQPQTMNDEVEKTVPSDTDKVSIHAMLKDLRYVLGLYVQKLCNI